MTIWWPVFQAPPGDRWRRREEILKTVLLLLAMITIVNVIGCRGCIHDILKPTRGTSPQKYNVDLLSILRSKLGKKLITTPFPRRRVGPTTNPRYRAGPGYNNGRMNTKRPKRYVEDSTKSGKNLTSRLRPNSRPNLQGRRISAVTSISNSSYQSRVDFKKLFKPIRIKLYFDNKHIQYKNTSHEYARLNNSLHRAVSTIEKILSVIPVEGPLLFKRTVEKICGSFWSEPSSSPDSKREKRCALASASYDGEKCLNEFKIPEDHLQGYPIYTNNTDKPTHMLYEDGSGLPNTDTVIYVHAEKNNLCNDKGVIAYATYCQLDQYNRPIAGFANFCPKHLEDVLYDEDVLYLTSLHEFFHALGFSKDLFDKFQECGPKKVDKKKDGDNDGKDKNTNKTSSIEWFCEDRRKIVSYIDNRKHIVTPAVTRETQKHLNCSTKRGCPLENHVVPPLRTSSHWEARFMQGSLMAPTIGLPHLTVIDRITLGAFEDMGWYQVDYKQAEDLQWGKNAGCNFATGLSCFNASSPFFCRRTSYSRQTGCHFLHLDKGNCETNEYLESCRTFKAHPGMECWKNKNETRLTDWKGEIYSRESRCFMSDLVFNKAKYQPARSLRQPEGRCFRHRCNDTNTLEVQVTGAEWKICPEGSYIEFENYAGRLHCPSTSLLCGYNFETTTAASVHPTSGSPNVDPYCAKITISFPSLAQLHVQMRNREKQSETARQAQNKLDIFIAKFVNEIVAATDIDQTRVVEIKFVSITAVQFTLLKNIDWTTFTPKDSKSSLSPKDYNSGVNQSGTTQPVAYNYKEVSCKEAIKRLLVSVSEGNFKVPVDGKVYKANNITVTDSASNLHAGIKIPTEKPPRTGMLAAVAVGSVCGAMLLAVGVMIYWKSQITTAVSPAPPSPTSTDVRYHPNNGSTVLPSENGSMGQLTFVA
ncbi:uncharacterized protein LOC120326056 isoform X1 [Styela clava]